MEHNSISPSEVATLSLLNGGYSLGNKGDDYLAANAHADGTANHSILKGILDQISNQSDQTRDLMRDRQFNDLALNVSDFKTEVIRLSGDQRVELQTKIDSVLAKVAECCCETQKEILKESSATRELINARALQDTQRALDSADRNSQTQALVAAIASINGNGHGQGQG